MNKKQKILRQSSSSGKSPKKKEGVFTRKASSGIKTVSTCFNCNWTFPQSFRETEVHYHIDRCLEQHSQEDIAFWTKCKGDLGQYK